MAFEGAGVKTVDLQPQTDDFADQIAKPRIAERGGAQLVEMRIEHRGVGEGILCERRRERLDLAGETIAAKRVGNLV